MTKAYTLSTRTSTIATDKITTFQIIMRASFLFAQHESMEVGLVWPSFLTHLLARFSLPGPLVTQFIWLSCFTCLLIQLKTCLLNSMHCHLPFPFIKAWKFDSGNVTWTCDFVIVLSRFHLSFEIKITSHGVPEESPPQRIFPFLDMPNRSNFHRFYWFMKDQHVILPFLSLLPIKWRSVKR